MPFRQGPKGLSFLFDGVAAKVHHSEHSCEQSLIYLNPSVYPAVFWIANLTVFVHRNPCFFTCLVTFHLFEVTYQSSEIFQESVPSKIIFYFDNNIRKRPHSRTRLSLRGQQLLLRQTAGHSTRRWWQWIHLFFISVVKLILPHIFQQVSPCWLHRRSRRSLP